MVTNPLLDDEGDPEPDSFGYLYDTEAEIMAMISEAWNKSPYGKLIKLIEANIARNILRCVRGKLGL